MALQVLLGDRSFDLDLTDGSVLLDGAPVEARMTRLTEHTVHLLLDGRSYVLTIEPRDGGAVAVTHAGRTRTLRVRTERDRLLERMGISAGASAAATELKAPMPGLVLQVLVEPGQAVEAGQGLVVLEAMKMENELRAEAAGTVAAVHVEPGAAVTKGTVLVSFAG